MLNCHCTVGVGLPLAAAVKIAVPPAFTVTSVGLVVTTGPAVTVSVAAVVVADPVVRAYGHSEDEYKKVDGHWLWARRKIYNEMMASRLAPAVNPAGSLGK